MTLDDMGNPVEGEVPGPLTPGTASDPLQTTVAEAVRMGFSGDPCPDLWPVHAGPQRQLLQVHWLRRDDRLQLIPPRPASPRYSPKSSAAYSASDSELASTSRFCTGRPVMAASTAFSTFLPERV